jgi:coenzyme F420 hydrogenase subunit beta
MSHKRPRPNIDRVHADHLCTECGACAGVCPKANLRIERAKDRDYVFRVIDPTRCGPCGLCVRVCPGLEVDFGGLYQALFPGQTPDPWFGCVQAAYLSRSTDPAAVRRGASGGTATTLLEFGLTTGRIDGALVVGMDPAAPHEPRVYVARTPEELHAATQSKYCPAPTCLSFREVMAVEGRYALVGIPCQVHALRKAQALFPRLRARVVFALGLYCGPGPSFHMMDHLLNRRGMKVEAVRAFHFRDKRVTGDHWPGGILALCGTAAPGCGGQEARIPLARYLYAQTLFTRRRCHVCPDYTNEFADLAMGDAHLHEFWADPPHYTAPSGRVLDGWLGWNAVVVRTATGEEWFEAARAAGRLDAEPLPLPKLKEGMAHACYRKKVEFWPRLRVHRLLGREAPSFPGLPGPPKLRLRQRLIPYARMVIGELIHWRLFRWLLTRLPERWLLKKSRLRRRLIDQAYQEDGEETGPSGARHRGSP